MEPEWQEAHHPVDFKIEYNYLPPGDYRLHLQAANINGQWSDVVTSGIVRIRPPYWQTTWFYALLFTCFAGGFVCSASVCQPKTQTVYPSIRARGARPGCGTSAIRTALWSCT